MSPELTEFLAIHAFSPQALSALHADGRFTPLMRACKQGRLDLVEELLAQGVDLGVTNSDGCNALWLACYHGDPLLIERLIDAGIEIDRQNGNGASCLMYVASNGKAALVALLLARGANPHLRNLDDFSALELASTPACLKLLRPYR